jgi:hypothetical protein
MKRITQLIFTSLAFLSALPVFAQIEYIHRSDRFAITFPSIPEVDERTRLSAHGVIFPARVYSAYSSSGNYSLTLVDYTEAEKRHRARLDQTDASSGATFWVMDVRASVAHEAQSIRESVRDAGGEITYEGWADIDKIEGHQMQITNKDQSRSFIGIHLNASRLYILEATSPQGFPPPAWFQQSLQFIDENGQRIRYTFDTDGQRTNIRIAPLADVPEGVRRVIVE